ncbi:MAG: hypothetical protein V3U29_09840 [Phycisphaeraceae bacterium]
MSYTRVLFLPDHVHMVARRHHYRIEQIVGRLKGKASEQLAADARHPFQDLADSSGRRPSPWARKGWNVYLNTDRDICRAVTYVEQNPVKEGKQPQRWSFVTPFGL